MAYYKQKYKLDDRDYLNSVHWGEGTLSLPFYPGLTIDEQNYVIEIVMKIREALES
jgi:dTDP-4-amino-4,6-dideoxygalactose transaminase